MWSRLPKWFRRWVLAPLLLGWGLAGAGAILGAVAPHAGQQAAARAATALCKDAHVHYADAQERMEACLRRASAKLGKQFR
jgi:hypothetical protein